MPTLCLVLASCSAACRQLHWPYTHHESPAHSPWHPELQDPEQHWGKKITLCGSVASDKMGAYCPPTGWSHRKAARTWLGSVSPQRLTLAAREGKVPVCSHQAPHFNGILWARWGSIRYSYDLTRWPSTSQAPGGLHDLPTSSEALEGRVSKSCPRAGRRPLLSVQCNSIPAGGRKPALGGSICSQFPGSLGLLPAGKSGHVRK